MKSKSIVFSLMLSTLAGVISLVPEDAAARTVYCTNCSQDGQLRDLLNKTDDAITQANNNFAKLAKQFTGNIAELFGGEARMKSLQDERGRQREIERVKFKAQKDAASTHRECVIRTRVRELSSFNRNDQRLSATTLATLEKIAAFNMGAEIGSSGTPKEAISVNQKASRFLGQMASFQCDPALAKAGLCSAAAPSPDDGIAYLPGKSLTSGINYESEKVETACSDYYSIIATGDFSDNASSVSSRADQNSPKNSQRYFTNIARKGLTQDIIAKYCSDRSPSKNANSTAANSAKAAAAHMEGYKQYQNAENISYLLTLEIFAKEWYAREDDKRDLSEIDALYEIQKTLGIMAVQNHELYKKMDSINLVNAMDMSVSTEILAELRKQTEKIPSRN